MYRVAVVLVLMFADMFAHTTICEKLSEALKERCFVGNGEQLESEKISLFSVGLPPMVGPESPLVTRPRLSMQAE